DALPISITQCAPVVTFTSTNWYQQVTVPLLADPAFRLPDGRDVLKTFPKRAHLLSGIRGPLAVEGGTTGADRALHQAVLLPGESNGPLFQIAAQPREWQQIDTLNVYADGSTQDLVGQMTSTAITGLNMTDDLDFTKSFPVGFKFPFGEPGKYPGGVSYGTITLDANGNFKTDGNTSTIEIVNLLLGQGNDTFTIKSTLVPGAELANNGTMRVASHGGLTTVHGGGNSPLQVAGTFDITAGATAAITRTDGVDWRTAGFAAGQQIMVMETVGASVVARSFTIVGFAGPASAPGSTLQVVQNDGGTPQDTTTGATATVSVTDAPGATRSSGSWSGAGFAIGQPVVLSGVDGLRRITGFANGGFTLVVDGLPLPTMTGVTVGQVRIGGDTIIVTGDTSTTAAG